MFLILHLILVQIYLIFS